MKFIVQFKDPDVLPDAIQEAVAAWASKIEGLDKEERKAVEEKRREKVGEQVDRWFRYGEYVSIEIDTDADTATVLGSK